jgi:hypothetical protein
MPSQDASTEALAALTVRQAAEKVRCSEALVRKLVRAEEVPAEKVETVTGFRYLIDEATLPVLAHKVAMRKGPNTTVQTPQSEGPHSEGVRAQDVEALRAERNRLVDEVRWLRAQFEEAQATIARLALPEHSPTEQRQGFWARLFGRG